MVLNFHLLYLCKSSCIVVGLDVRLRSFILTVIIIMNYLEHAFLFGGAQVTYQTHKRFSLQHLQIQAHSSESCHCQLFLTNSYKTATQVVYFVVSLGPISSTRTKINFNFMKRVYMCKRKLSGKAGKWIILCCSSLDLQSLDLYKLIFSSSLYEGTLEQQRTTGSNSPETKTRAMLGASQNTENYYLGITENVGAFIYFLVAEFSSVQGCNEDLMIIYLKRVQLTYLLSYS